MILLLIELTNNHMLCSVLPTENSEALSMSLLFRVFVWLIAVIVGINHVLTATSNKNPSGASHCSISPGTLLRLRAYGDRHRHSV